MRSSFLVWVLTTESMGVFGGVVLKPCDLNKTAIASISQPYSYRSRLPIPIPKHSSCISSEIDETATNSSTPTVIPTPHPSVAYAAPSLPAEALPLCSSPPTAINMSAPSPTLVYSPLSSSAILTYPSSTPEPISDHTFVVTVVVSKTVFNSPTPINSVNSYSVSWLSSSSEPTSQQPKITAFDAPSSSIVSSSAVQSLIPSSIPDTDMLAALQASSTINLGLLSSIFYGSNIIPRSISVRTTTVTTVVIINTTIPGPLPTSSVGAISTAPTTAIPTSLVVLPSPSASQSPIPASSQTIVRSTSANPSNGATTDFPTLPPFSYNPSASRGSATPITRPGSEHSNANAVSSTIGTATVSSSTFISQYSGIPPAPSAAGSSGGLNGKVKETVWWVVFFVPFMLMA